MYLNIDLPSIESGPPMLATDSGQTAHLFLDVRFFFGEEDPIWATAFLFFFFTIVFTSLFT
jgi:hypothetical protein